MQHRHAVMVHQLKVAVGLASSRALRDSSPHSGDELSDANQVNVEQNPSQPELSPSGGGWSDPFKAQGRLFGKSLSVVCSRGRRAPGNSKLVPTSQLS